MPLREKRLTTRVAARMETSIEDQRMFAVEKPKVFPAGRRIRVYQRF